MDITMENTNRAGIEELLHRFINFPVEDHLPIDQVFSEKYNGIEFTHFSVLWPPDSGYPRHLVLKINPDNRREVQFFQTVRSLNASLPVARCLGCEHSQATGQSTVLIEDLTLSHSNVCDWPMPIPQQAGFALVEALAELHAAFWHHPVVGDSPTLLPDFLRDEPSHQAHIDSLKHDFEIYLAGAGNCLEIPDCQIYPEILRILPSLWDKFWKPRLSTGPLPLIHGDLNPCNILYPKKTSGKVVLVNWESSRHGLPAGDLAMLFGLYLCPEYDNVLPFLHRYHQALLKLGIEGYSFEDLEYDYEVALLYEIFNPLSLYAQKGVQDEFIIQNSLLALNSLRDARF
jgi:aminoglycoside phosphotransferase (APT) family kinase protein